jgi:prevent-host-death family protein
MESESSRSPQLETMTVSEARSAFSETLNRVYRGEARVSIEKNGIPIGGIVSAQDLHALQRLDELRELSRRAFGDDIRENFGETPESDLVRQLTEALAKVQENRRNAKRDQGNGHTS